MNGVIVTKEYLNTMQNLGKDDFEAAYIKNRYDLIKDVADRNEKDNGFLYFGFKRFDHNDSKARSISFNCTPHDIECMISFLYELHANMIKQMKAEK